MSVRDAVPTDLQPVFDAAVDALSAADCHGPGIEIMGCGSTRTAHIIGRSDRMTDMTLADEIELADARMTIHDARRYLDWTNRTGEFEPRSGWQEFWALLGGMRSFRLPPIPVHPESVRQAEIVLEKFGRKVKQANMEGNAKLAEWARSRSQAEKETNSRRGKPK